MKRILIVVAGVGLGVAGCGSSGKSATTGLAGSASPTSGSKASAMVAFARCMRSHGVPSFPDPGSGLRIEQRAGSVSVNGVALNGPAFSAAQQTCHSYLPNGGQAPKLNASQRQAALQFSQCMRAHGLPEFPDPNFSGGGIQLRLSRSSGMDPNSPAFQAAQKACGSFLPKRVVGG